MQLVVTAPGQEMERLVSRLGCRTTVGVLVQLLAEAKTEIILGAPFIQARNGHVAFPSVHVALEAALKRGVTVDLVGTGKSLAAAAPALAKHQGGGLRLLQPRANWHDADRLGMHAKFCIADRARAYVGSANLTGPGLDEHLEMGLLVEGELAGKIWTFWQDCFDRRVFVSVAG